MVTVRPLLPLSITSCWLPLPRDRKIKTLFGPHIIQDPSLYEANHPNKQPLTQSNKYETNWLEINEEKHISSFSFNHKNIVKREIKKTMIKTNKNDHALHRHRFPSPPSHTHNTASCVSHCIMPCPATPSSNALHHVLRRPSLYHALPFPRPHLAPLTT